MAYVLTSLEAIEKLFLYIDDIDNGQDLLQREDQLYYNACILLLGVIGEETKKISPKIKDDFPHIPWQEIVRMRNRISHDYRGVDADIVYVTIAQKLDPLKDALIKIYQRIPYSSDKRQKILASPYYSHLQYLNNDHE